MRVALTALLTLAVVFGGSYGLGVALAEDEVFEEDVPDWEVIEVADDGRSFTIQYTAGNPACHSEVVDSRETPARVLVTVLVRSHIEGTGSKDNCEDFAVGRRRELSVPILRSGNDSSLRSRLAQAHEFPRTSGRQDRDREQAP